MNALLSIIGLIGIIYSLVVMVRTNRKQKSLKTSGVILIFSFALFFAGCAINPNTPENSSNSTITQNNITTNIPETTPKNTLTTTPIATTTSQNTPEPLSTSNPPESTTPISVTLKELQVTFIDVGQADSILVKAPDGVMLIDAGNNADANAVVSYLKNQGISKIDVLVGTHPHEDHIGGLDAVIDNFDIGNIYMPKVSHTTKTYEDVLTAIKNKGLKVSAPSPGITFNVGEAKCTVLAPNGSSYEDLNNYSIVIKLEYGNTSFIFTGDAEEISEREMLVKGFNLSADVLKVGHHGSNSSTTVEFLSAVSPKHAVISVGDGNDYGHPHAAILARLNELGVKIYRTDEVGTIIATSDGKTITFDKEASPIKENAPPQAENDSKKPSESVSSNIVYVTKTGQKYHSDGCRYLSNSKISIDLDAAIASGYTPCSVCNPPAPSSKSNAANTNVVTKETNKSSSSNSSDKKEIIVYITKTGAKYHSSGCSYLKKSSIPIEISSAKNSGYTPCSRCNPPR